MTGTVTAADLFCGAGGTSTGMGRACRDLKLKLDLLAVNHWPIAIETHSRNHPAARHLCESLDGVNPRQVVPSGHLNLLVASPECTHHSRARGGKPTNEQSRASGWHVPRWLEALKVDALLVENVPEWEEWGPTGADNKPLKSRRGETFKALMHCIEALGYRVEWKVLCAADYGDPTTRKRLFVMARRGKKHIDWPEASHAKRGSQTLFDTDRKPWRAAREVIDWTMQGQSIFDRKKPLAPATMNRIIEGLRRFGGPTMEPFVVALRNHMVGRSVDEPLSAITAGGTHLGLAEPFLMHLTHGGRVHDLDVPFPTITGAHRGELGVCEPFLLSQASGGAPRPVGEPMPTICADGATALIDASFIVPNFGERPTQTPRTHSVEDPMPAVTSHGAGCLVQPFMIAAGGPTGQGRNPKHVDAPFETILAENHMGLVQPFIMSAGGPKVNPRSTEEPLNTCLTRDHMALATPFLTKYYGTGIAASVDEPIDTITAKGRFGLATPLIFRQDDGSIIALDIRFRMLQPHELAGGMGFDADYVFAGNKGDAIKQIGNAVPGELARALCRAQLAPFAEARSRPPREHAA